MDPRLYPPKQTNPLLQLPKELLETILLQLDFDSAVNAANACYRFSFTLRPHIAAHLYKTALEARADISWIIFKKLEQFIQIDKNHAWAQYYLGVMRLHGQGQVTDVPSGLVLLSKSLLGGDFNAARELGEWILKNPQENPLWVNQIMLTLEVAHQRGDARATFVLGQMQAEPLLPSYNLKKARVCFNKCLEAGNVKAIAALGQMILDPEKRIDFYYHLENQFTSSTAAHSKMRAELSYLRSRQYHLLSNEDEHYNNLDMAALFEHPLALYEMGKINEEGRDEEGEDEAYDLALGCYKKGMYLNEKVCTEKYVELLLQPEADEVIEHAFIQVRMLKVFTKYNISHAAAVMSWYLIRFYPINDIGNYPIFSLWFQLAVQYGESLQLKNMEHLWGTFSPKLRPLFFGCALGIIHALGTKEMQPNKLIATYYFKEVMELNTNALQDYISTGIRTGLLNEVVLAELKKFPVIGSEIAALMKQPRKRKLLTP